MTGEILYFRLPDSSANPQRAYELEAAARERIVDGLQVGDVIRMRYPTWSDWQEHAVVSISARGTLWTQRPGRKSKMSWTRRRLGSAWSGLELEFVRRAGGDATPNGEAQQ